MARTDSSTEQSVLDLLRQSIPGRAVSRLLGIPETTVRAIKQRSVGEHFTEVARQYATAPQPKPAGFYSADKPNIPVSSIPLRVFAIGDSHDDLHVDKRRFSWMGRHVAATAPDAVTHIGDLVGLESLSTHAKNDSFTGKHKPPFVAEMESLDQALELFHEPIEQANIQIGRYDLTLGNHEFRMIRYEEENPEIAGVVQEKFAEIMYRYEWNFHKFGEYIKLGGVSFTHAPLSIMGRPMGGMNVDANIARQAGCDIVHGHTHRTNVVTLPRLGGDEKVTVIDLGTSLPQGFVEPYAKHTTTGWGWGVWDLIIQNGRIVGHSYIPMSELQRRYA